MPTFLRVVDLPTRCFLREVLFWVAFQRLPIATYDLNSIEMRESPEINDYSAEHSDIGEIILERSESQRAGIPLDPRLKKRIELYCSQESGDSVDAILKSFGVAREELDVGGAISIEEEFDAWKPYYERFVEYPKSQIFIALREGRLQATGRLLPANDPDEAFAIMEEQDSGYADIAPNVIPPAFWTLKDIDFESSAASDGARRYCHITCEMDEVLSQFPGERQHVGDVERIGDSFVLPDVSQRPRALTSRGRPSYPWDSFHVEVAATLHERTLPEKKEAAIQYFQDWFQRRHGIKVSRSAIGQKLTDYYAAIVKRQKT
jgi:hypothetical protein